MKYHNIYLEKVEGIGVLTVNRPKVLNALNFETLREIDHLFDALDTDQGTEVVIITGAGEKSFVAGADISEIVALNAVEGKYFSEIGQKVMSKIENFSKPVIAAINGFALGGGTELALSCHIRIASNKAKMGLPEVSLGLIPGYGGTQRLAKIIGKGRAIELTLTGKMIDADEAYRIGLINKVVSPEELLDSAKTLAQEIIKNGPLAIRYALEAITLGTETTIERGLKHESHLFGIVCSSEDKREGTNAFLQKRKANFQNK